MAQITISMPEQLSEWVQAQVDMGHYGNAEEYLCALVRRDRERKGQALQKLRQLIAEGYASGISKRTLPEIWDSARQEARRRGLLPAEG